jgi:DNA-binding beta-propeller fold protein YncE
MKEMLRGAAPQYRWTLAALASFLMLGASEYRVPGLNYPAQVGEGVTILPGGRVLKPYGRTVFTGNGPFAISVSPSGRTVITANLGISPATGIYRPSITTILPAKRDSAWNLSDFAAEPRQPNGKAWQGVAAGIALTGDSTAWIAEGDSGRVVELNVTTGMRKSTTDVRGPGANGSFTGALVYDSTRALIAVVDVLTSRVLLIDAKRAAILGSVRTSAAPVAITISPDAKRVYVATTAGLVTIDPTEPTAPKIIAETRTAPAAGIACDPEQVYLSLPGQDAIVVINAQSAKIEAEIPLRIPGLDEYRGVTPLGLAFESKSKRLLVAEAGINAVAVIDPAARRVVGHIPTGWFPNFIAVHNDEIYVASARGTGTGPSSPAQRIRLFGAGKPQSVLMDTAALRRGCVTSFAMPSETELAHQTDVVFQTCGFKSPQAPVGKNLPPIRHVVVIETGNRSFDEVFGDVDRAGDRPVLGDASYARYGMDGYVSGGKVRFSLRVGVTPNQHRIADRWALADNYYADSDFSAAGRRWLTGAIPDLFSATSLLYEEAGNRSPYDVPSAGKLLEHLAAHQIDGHEFTDDSFKELIDSGQPIPQFSLVKLIPPKGEFPYEATRVALKDLAIGQMLEMLSKTPIWKDTAVFVTGTGAEGGADHVDSHRTVLIGAGPWFRSNYVSHTNTSAPALIRTILTLFNAPPLNLYDATAGDLLDMFGAVPDFTRYDALPEDPRLFN